MVSYSDLAKAANAGGVAVSALKWHKTQAALTGHLRSR